MGEEHLKKTLGYPKFKGTPRVLVLDTGYLTVRDIMESAADLGWAVASVSMKSKGEAEGSSLADLLKAAVVHRPDFLITVNHLGFDEANMLSDFLCRCQMPTASWFVDHPMPVLGAARRNTSDFMQVFTFEKTSLSWLLEHGFDDPGYLPTGANRRYFHPSRIDTSLRDKSACSFCFAGNSWWTKARLEPSPQILKAAKKASKAGPVNSRSLLNGFEARLTKALPGDKRARYAAAQVMLAEASMQKRKSFARALLPLGLRIFGDPHWSTLAPGIDLRPFVDNQKGLPALFSGCAVNANVTAEQMPTAVNQRVWDVPAAGGFLLTDAQEDALDFFKEDEEIAVYRTFEEAADKARYYLENEDKRQSIARRALEQVDRFHGLAHRLSAMADVMRRKFG